MFTKWIDDTLDAQVRDLQALVRIPSVSRGEPREGMPLGQGVHDALTTALALANRLGFADTRSLENGSPSQPAPAGTTSRCAMMQSISSPSP